MKTLIERIRWWIYHPKFELIYLLGGIPKEHNGTLHYRNIFSVVGSLQDILGKNAVIDHENGSSHYHCWHQIPPACGIPIEEHTQCCLCEAVAPQEV